MLSVTVNGEKRTYTEGTSFYEIAQDFQPQYENDILLVRANGKLKELHKTLDQDTELTFLTARSSAGHKTYERSAIFVMLKAFYDVIEPWGTAFTGNFPAMWSWTMRFFPG